MEALKSRCVLPGSSRGDLLPCSSRLPEAIAFLVSWSLPPSANLPLPSAPSVTSSLSLTFLHFLYDDVRPTWIMQDNLPISTSASHICRVPFVSGSARAGCRNQDAGILRRLSFSPPHQLSQFAGDGSLPGHGTFSAETSKVPGKHGLSVALSQGVVVLGRHFC